VHAEATARATPEVVWALVSDADQYPKWGPWIASGYKKLGDTSPHGVGAVQWFRASERTYLRRATSVEKILEVEEGRRLVYTIVGGIPAKNYRAEVVLTPVAAGTHVHWAASWDNTFAGRIVLRKLRQMYPQIVASLVAAAEGVSVLDEQGQPGGHAGVDR
jgi:uncharacterized protein YndB with AHSA1/START domain